MPKRLLLLLHLQGLHIAFRNQIDTGEEAAKAVRSHTSIMAAPPAGPAGALAPYAAAYSDTEPSPEPSYMPGTGLNSAGAVHSTPGSVGYSGVGAGHHSHVPGRGGGVNGDGDVVLQMSNRARH